MKQSSITLYTKTNFMPWDWPMKPFVKLVKYQSGFTCQIDWLFIDIELQVWW